MDKNLLEIRRSKLKSEIIHAKSLLKQNAKDIELTPYQNPENIAGYVSDSLRHKSKDLINSLDRSTSISYDRFTLIEKVFDVLKLFYNSKKKLR